MKEVEEFPEKSLKSFYQSIAFLAFFVIFGFTWQVIRKQKINNDGVYVVATVTKTETFKGGYFASLKYSFNGKVYQVSTRSMHGKEEVGDHYFVQLLPTNPGEIDFLEEHPVPSCLLPIEMPKRGWKSIPTCKK